MIKTSLSACALVIACSAPVLAGEVCNETSFVVEVATAWDGDSAMTVAGWTRLRPGECGETQPRTAPEGGAVFLYARSSDAYLGGVREWRGAHPFCVGDDTFSYEGVQDCLPLGMEERHFRQLSADEMTRTILVEPSNFGERADEAGLQRLLQSAGYDIRNIDGFAGRRTTRAISAFEGDVDQQFGSNRAGLMDALERAAHTRNVNAGLNICNDASAPIAVAVARLRPEGWQSKGWWRIETGQCERTIAARLSANETFAYAMRIEGDTPEPMVTGTQGFCLAPARFLAEGENECEARGYQSAQFRAVPAPENGASTLRFNDGDFVSAPQPHQAGGQ